MDNLRDLEKIRVYEDKPVVSVFEVVDWIKEGTEF